MQLLLSLHCSSVLGTGWRRAFNDDCLIHANRHDVEILYTRLVKNVPACYCEPTLSLPWTTDTSDFLFSSERCFISFSCLPPQPVCLFENTSVGRNSGYPLVCSKKKKQKPRRIQLLIESFQQHDLKCTQQSCSQPLKQWFLERQKQYYRIHSEQLYPWCHLVFIFYCFSFCWNRDSVEYNWGTGCEPVCAIMLDNTNYDNQVLLFLIIFFRGKKISLHLNTICHNPSCLSHMDQEGTPLFNVCLLLLFVHE